MDDYIYGVFVYETRRFYRVVPMALISSPRLQVIMFEVSPSLPRRVESRANTSIVAVFSPIYLHVMPYRYIIHVIYKCNLRAPVHFFLLIT